MKTVNPYLVFDGNCEEAFNFYKNVFGGDFQFLGRFSDMPEADCKDMPEESMNKIMHVSLPISKETILMGSDANPNMGAVSTGNNVSLSLSTESKEEADTIFNSLSKDGKVTMPMQDTFWGSYFGMLEDKYGFIWMVGYDTIEH
ncbi:VOC family protein [Gillisia marina]|uniref:VOC family protein n=1 Tax=Gillisia marina TaxID=1167637 RepID=UPI000299EF0C|nr:VOC family protein [Gillisia marina]